MTHVGNDSYVWFDGFSNHLAPRRPTSSCTELVIYNPNGSFTLFSCSKRATSAIINHPFGYQWRDKQIYYHLES
jgi:hypothetical protein